MIADALGMGAVAMWLSLSSVVAVPPPVTSGEPSGGTADPMLLKAPVTMARGMVRVTATW
jgi:hypothetical protein